MMRNVNYAALSAVALLVSVPFLLDTTAQEAKTTATVATVSPTTAAPAPDFNDPAFERYVDLLLLGQAWDTLDPVLLTDCALQLAEGERILMRSHKAIASSEVIELATKIAAEKRDSATLDRLAKVLTARNDTPALEKVTSARKLASASRKSEPALSVSAAESNPDQLFVYQEAINGAKAATAAGDMAYFTNLESALGDKECILVRLSPAQKAYLAKLISDTKPLMSKTSNPGLSDTLMKLKEASRESRFNPNSPTGSFGYQEPFGGNLGFGQGGTVFGQPSQGGQQPQYPQTQYPQQQPPYQQYQPQYTPQYQPQYQPQYGQGYQPQSYYPAPYYPRPAYRPPCYSPSTYGSHGWCGNR